MSIPPLSGPLKSVVSAVLGVGEDRQIHPRYLSDSDWKQIFGTGERREQPPSTWPAPGSSLSRLTTALKAPGAISELKMHLRATFTTQISEQLRFMGYQEFLGTQYWEIVRAVLVVTRGAFCEDCGQCGPLDAHHLTYVHRGEEVFHLEDLRLLCRACHMARHTE